MRKPPGWKPTDGGKSPSPSIENLSDDAVELAIRSCVRSELVKRGLIKPGRPGRKRIEIIGNGDPK